MKVSGILFFLVLCVFSCKNNNFEEASNCRDKGAGKINSAKTYDDYSEARIILQQGLIFTEAYLKDAELHFMRLRLQHNIGSSYLAQKNYESAFKYYNSVNEDLATYKRKFERMPLYIPVKFNNALETARTYMAMDELELSNLFFEEAHKTTIDAPENTIREERLIRLYTDFASLLRRKEAHTKSEAYALKALALSDKAVNAAQKDLADTIKSLTKARIVVTDTTKAIEEFKTALSDAELSKADLYMNMANNQHDARQYDKAQTYFLQALNLYKGKKTPNELSCIKNLGESYRKHNKLEAADKILSASINGKRDNSANERADTAGLYINRGETRYDAKNDNEAYKDYQKALEYLQYAPNTEGSLPPIDAFNGNRFTLLMTLNDIALVRLRQKDTTKAIAVYDTVRQLINLIRSDYIGEADKMSVSGKTRPIMEKAASVFLDLYEKSHGRDVPSLERAFNFSEQSKAMTLRENTKLKQTAKLSEDIKEQLRKLNYDLGIAEQKTITEPTNAVFSNELRQLNSKKQNIWQTIKKVNSNNNDNEVKIADVQKYLANDQTLVEYFIEKETVNRLHIFVIRKNAPIFHKSVPIDPTFEQNIDSVAAYLTDRSTDHQKQYCERAHSLYKTLIEPIQDSLTQKRVLIIPEYPLSKIPFAALVTQPNVTTYTDVVEKGAFWDKSISYNYSASFYVSMMEANKNKEKTAKVAKVATFAPSFTHTIKTSLTPTIPDSFTLTPIANKFNQNETDAINQSINATNYVDKQATKSNLLSALSNNTVVHISTHGVLMNNPKLSFISVTQTGETFDKNEVLTLSELYTKSLSLLQLVFLSACETGISHTENYKGEGMMSLSWALASAGVQSFITTLWSVNAEATSQLTPEFYKSLKDNATTKDVALYEAQKTYLKQHASKANPHFWAGFVLVGNTEGVVFDAPTADSNHFPMAISSLFAVALGWFFYKRKKKKDDPSV